MKILDLFAGIGGERRRERIEKRGHKLITLDIEHKFKCTITGDFLSHITEKEILDKGPYDFVWASPPCEAFSVASIGCHWSGGHRRYSPKTEHAKISQKLVSKTISIIKALEPRAWIIENPVGVLRKLACIKGIPRITVTYCQYGDKSRMKPTDLWGVVPGWIPRIRCKNGDNCHEAAPRGSKTGTQGIQGSAERAVVPWEIWEEILTVLENSQEKEEVFLTDLFSVW